MRALERAGLVLSDTLGFQEILDEDGRLERVNVFGRIVCAEDVTVEVDKWLEVEARNDGRCNVRGEFYTYHSWRTSDPPPAREILRYDSSSAEQLHVHVFDRDGIEVGEKQFIDRAALPNLDQFIEVVCAIAAAWERVE